MMHYLIYKITNRLNNKIYVGKHKTENKDDDYFGSGLLLGRAVEKHGKENFVKEILFECSSEEEMNKKEEDIVDEEFIARDDTYNIMLGGRGGFSYINGSNSNNNGRTLESRKKSRQGSLIGGAVTKKKWAEDPEFGEEIRTKWRNSQSLQEFFKRGNAFVGRKHSEETKRKIGAANSVKLRGEKNPSFGKHWITDGKVNKLARKADPIPFGFSKGRV